MAQGTAQARRGERAASARPGTIQTFERVDSAFQRAPGLASMTSRMLQQGTTTRSAPQIADRAAELGATLNTRASTDSSVVSTHALSRNFPDALELLADVALHPNFPQAEIERVRSERLAALV